MSLQYNTAEDRLRLQQYGRMVQEMIDHAKTLSSRFERQAAADDIIEVMAQVTTQSKAATPNFEETLWNHLAYMANYELDIDYPCLIEVQKEGSRPAKLSYPGHKIHLRHYGYLVENALMKLKETAADAPEREELIRITALRMRRYMADWKGGGADNERVGLDMERYTDGAVRAEEAVAQLEQVDARRQQNAFQSRPYRRRR